MEYILSVANYYGDKGAIENAIKTPSSDKWLVKFNPNKDTIRKTAPSPGHPWNPKLKKGDLMWVGEDLYIFAGGDTEWEHAPPKGFWVKIITKTLTSNL